MENKCNKTTSKPKTENTNVYRSVALPSQVKINMAAYISDGCRRKSAKDWQPSAAFYANAMARHNAMSLERERELDREYEREKKRELEERRAKYGPGTRWEILKRLCE